MAASAVIAKVAATVATDKNLRKIAGGIILGIIICIIAPIAILLGIGDAGQSIDWDSPEMRRQIYDNMTDEEKARFQQFEDMLTAIENEITAQGLDVEPIKAQVIFLCVEQHIAPMADMEGIGILYSDFVSCFADGADDETVFANITEKFGVTFTAEEKEKILLLCEKAMEHQEQNSEVAPP